MTPVDEHVGVASAVRISNAWLLKDGDGRRFLVDTGHRVERRSLARHLRAAGVERPGDLEAVLLTHRHSDHAGNAAWARERFRCPVVCHVSDAARLEGREPPVSLGGRGAALFHDALCRVEDAFPARSTVDETFESGAWRWGWTAVPVPGHTEGSTMLLHEPSGALFSGDAILAGPPVQRLAARLTLAVPAYSLDVDRCRRAVLSFLSEEPDVRTLCAGHGPPIRRGLRRRLRRLLSRHR